MAERECWWCGGPIAAPARRDKKTCSKTCRQARSRFRVGSAPLKLYEPMRFAYADPPYPGLAKQYYGTSEVNHQILIGTLTMEFPDGWALSTSSTALQDVLAMCPRGARVACWVRGARAGKSIRPRCAWEPLIVYGGRPWPHGAPEESSDTLLWGGRQTSHPGALIGMKSAAFAEWMFQQLGVTKGDELVDVFPGSGIVGRAWDVYMAGGVEDSCLTSAAQRLGARLGEEHQTMVDRLSTEARTKAYDLTSLSANTALYEDFTEVFDQLYPILVELRLDPGAEILKRYEEVKRVRMSEPEDYLPRVRAFSEYLLYEILTRYP